MPVGGGDERIITSFCQCPNIPNNKKLSTPQPTLFWSSTLHKYANTHHTKMLYEKGWKLKLNNWAQIELLTILSYCGTNSLILSWSKNISY